MMIVIAILCIFLWLFSGVHIHQNYLERPILEYKADQVVDAEEDLL